MVDECEISAASAVNKEDETIICKICLCLSILSMRILTKCLHKPGKVFDERRAVLK